MVEYALPNINNLACGVVKCKLYVDNSLPSLAAVLPTSVPFLNIGDGRESIDMEAGVTDIDQLDVTVAEDYTYCSEGFWHRIINGYPTKTITSTGNFAEPVSSAATTAVSLTFGLHTIDRAAGDFTGDGWAIGMVGIILHAGANNNVRFTVTNVSALQITVAESLAIISPGISTTLQASVTFTRASGSFVTDGWKIGYSGVVSQVGANNGWHFTVTGVAAATLTVLEAMFVIGATDCTLTSDPVDTDIELMFTIMEGTDETFWFRGKLYRKDAHNAEYYLDQLSGTPTKWVRGIKFKLTSSLQMLQNIPVIALIEECALHTTAIPAYSLEVISLGKLVASAITLAYGESFDVGLCVNNSADVRVVDSTGIITNTWDKAGVVIKSNSSYQGYFWSYGTNQFSWYQRFKNAYDLLKFILFPFGVIPKYQFGTSVGLIDGTPANNHHMLIFDSRGGGAVTVTMDGKIKESSFISDTARKARTIRISDPLVTGYSYWYLNGNLRRDNVPPYAQFDIDHEIDFNVNSNIALYATVALIIFDSGTGLYVGAATQCDYWNYHDGNRQVVTESADNCLAKTTALYYYYRYQKGRFEWTREYSGLSANNGSSSSQRWNKTLAIHAIHDGVVSRNFYSTEVSKSLINNKCSVVWVEQ
jgi:hypothetical protein